MIRTFTLSISPQTHVRSTQGDKKCFQIPENVLQERYPQLYKRKLRLIRYNEYKVDLAEECMRKGFTLLQTGMNITFYVPCPRSWRPGKKKKHHLTPHQSTPDVDNLLKPLLDVYTHDPRVKLDDKTIWHIAGMQKLWVDFPIGWIKIETGHLCSALQPSKEHDPLQLLIQFEPPEKRRRKPK